MIEPYVYPPRDQEDAEQWLDEHFAKVACRDGIEEILRDGFDGSCLKSGCARNAIEKFGLRQVEAGLASTVRERSWDERFSRRTVEWANACPASSKDPAYSLNAHSVVVDGFVRQYLRAVEEMAQEAREQLVEGQFPQMTL